MKGNGSALKSQIRQVLILSLPAILTQITTIVMQYIDSAMVGALGADASAAIGLVSSSTWLLGGVTYAVSAGFSVQVAHRIGANQEAEARNVVRHGLLSALAVSGILCLTGIAVSSCLPAWLGGDPAIRANASQFRHVCAGRHFQLDLHPDIRRFGCGHRNGSCLCRGQLDDGMALLYRRCQAGLASAGARTF